MIKILNTYHLSNLIGIRWEIFKQIISNIDDNYSSFEIKKKAGGLRSIESPSEELYYCQKFVKEEILENIRVFSGAYGFVKGKSIKMNAVVHARSQQMISLDIEDFFGSFKTPRIYYVFNSLCNYSKEVSMVLTKLCTYKGVLPQGAPTSPILSNICFYKVDLKIKTICDENSLIYSRYADDISISSKEKFVDDIVYEIETILKKSGFGINISKSRTYKEQPFLITGLKIMNQTVCIPNTYVKKIKTELYFIEKFGLDSHLEYLRINQNIYNKNYLEHLFGKIMFVREINKRIGNALIDDYNRILIEYD